MHAQTTQITIGSAGANESFNDVKFDSLRGGTVEAGTVNNNAGNGNDCFIVRRDASKQVLWQKAIASPGEDVLNRVIVCANGDYVAAGQLFVNGVRRAFVCRLNSGTGDILWSATSNNSFVGELFWDVVETANHNIALVGADAFQNGTNCFLVMLNQSGALVWSRISTQGVPDQFTTINQLPNGNLILGGHYDAGGLYNTVIMEVDTATGTIKTQNTYSINTSLPGGVGNVNSILETRCFVKDNQVSFSLFLFNGYGSPSNLAICKYDQATRTLSGNVMYHNGNNSPYTYSYYPVANNDYIVSQSFSSPVSVFLSRVTANTVVFDKKITNAVNAVGGIDVLGNSVVSSGSYSSSISNSDGFSLFSPLGISAGPICNMTDAGTMTLLPLNLAPSANNAISFRAASSMTSFNGGVQNTNNASNTICTTVQPGTGTGLQGTYYKGIYLSGSPLLNRIDPSIDFEFTYSKQPVVLSPAPGVVPEDEYSVRWTGQVQPIYSENYTFSVLSDDGVRLWVNGVQLIDNWTNQSATEKSGSIVLQAGQKYDIKLEYYENTGEAVTKLYWSSNNTAKQIIPQSQLYPVTVTPPAGGGTGLLGTYFNGIALTGAPLLSRVDPTVNMELTYSKQPLVLSPAPGVVPEDLFSVRWSGQVQAKFSEAYTFYLQSDDGVRLWVNGVKLIDNWVNQGTTETFASIALTAGEKYNIVVEYYENTGEAVAKLLWSSASTPKAIIPQAQLYPAAIPPAGEGSGTGLRGYYYNDIYVGNAGGSGTPGGPLLLTRIDTTVNFELTYSKQPVVMSPAPGIVPEDMFSIRWAGQVEAQYSETYTFYTACDDGVRLFVDGRTLIDNWQNQGVTETSNTIDMIAGRKYDIFMHYYEYAGEAVAKLSWSSPSTPKQIVPKSRLYPAAVSNTRSVDNGAALQVIPFTANDNTAAVFSAVLQPNPVKSGQSARLQVTSNKTGKVIVTVMSSNGNSITSRSLNLAKGVNSAGISTSGLAQGLYFVNIAGGAKPITMKLIVE